MSNTHDRFEQVKQVGDGIAATGTGAALLGFVPEITAVLTMLYVLVRLYETDTVRKIFRNKDEKDK